MFLKIYLCISFFGRAGTVTAGFPGVAARGSDTLVAVPGVSARGSASLVAAPGFPSHVPSCRARTPGSRTQQLQLMGSHLRDFELLSSPFRWQAEAQRALLTAQGHTASWHRCLSRLLRKSPQKGSRRLTASWCLPKASSSAGTPPRACRTHPAVRPTAQGASERGHRGPGGHPLRAESAGPRAEPDGPGGRSHSG